MSRVETSPAVNVLTSHCETRGDKWVEEVLHRLYFCNNLLGKKAVYHTNVWMTNFKFTVPSENRRGRPANQIMMDSFKYEADTELYNLSEIYYKTEELAEETLCYTQKYLKVGLPEHYGEHILFAEQPG